MFQQAFHPIVRIPRENKSSISEHKRSSGARHYSQLGGRLPLHLRNPRLPPNERVTIQSGLDSSLRHRSSIQSILYLHIPPSASSSPAHHCPVPRPTPPQSENTNSDTIRSLVITCSLLYKLARSETRHTDHELHTNVSFFLWGSMA